MSTAADEKRWAIAPPASDDSTDLGNELRLEESSGDRARKRNTGTSPSRQHLTEPAGSVPDAPETTTGESSLEERASESDRERSRPSPPRSSTSALRRRATLPAAATSADGPVASSSRELETLAPESSSPFASEPAISERIPRGRRSRSHRDGGDTIPAPSPEESSLDGSPFGSAALGEPTLDDRD